MSKSKLRDVTAARLLLEYYGGDSLSYFSLHEKKKFFFSSTGKSFLSYVIKGKVALVSGDPISPKEDIGTLLEEFNYFIKGKKLTSCFLGVTVESLPSLLTLGYRQMHIGDEAVISLSGFNKSLLKKRVRRAEKHILNLGIVSKVYKRSEIPDIYYRQLKVISKEWILNHGQKERGFSMTLGRIPKIIDNDCEIVLALKKNKVLGYLTLVPTYTSKGLSIDEMRKRKNTPNGLTEFLLLQACTNYQRHNIEELSLNFATFNRHKKQTYKNPLVLLRLNLYKILSYFYKTNNLYAFNNKFLPDWRERYMIFEKRRYLPYYLLAIASVES